MKLVRKLKTKRLFLSFVALLVFFGIEVPAAHSVNWYPAPVRKVMRSCDYYPCQQVYYCPRDFKYYWLDGQVWKSYPRGVPDWINLGKKVTIETDEPKPYYRHVEPSEECS